jgi:hypothetical protein
MDDAERLRLLNAVAAGELTPDAAAALLDADDPDDASARARPGPTPSGPAERVELHVVAASVKVVSDPTLTDVEVDGPHRLDRDGTTAVVRVESRSRAALAAIRSGRRPHPGRGRRSGAHATVRVPPGLELEVHAHAAAVRVSSVDAPLTVHATSSFVRIREATIPFDLSLQASRLHLGARLTHGSSTIRLHAASATIDLDASSDLTVDASVELGSLSTRLHLDQRPERTGHFVIGSGAAELDITGAVSSVVVRSAGDERRVA